MANDNDAQPLARYRLNEQRRQVANCVGKEGLRLPPDRFERLISDLEELIAEFLSSARGASFRDVHEALRRLWFCPTKTTRRTRRCDNLSKRCRDGLPRIWTAARQQ